MCSRFTDKRPQVDRGPVQGTALRPRECHWRVLQLRNSPSPEIAHFTPPVRLEGMPARQEGPSCRSRRVDISPPDPSRPRMGPSTHEPSPPQNPHPFLAGGLAGAASNDHAAAKLSRQTLMRCAALLASHHCHPSPPPEPFISPGAGVSLAHGRHIGLKMA